MAYRIEGNDIVIDGWENGISENPYKGINDMRGVNIVSIPGEVSVSFDQVNKTFDNCTGSITSADPATEIVTVSLTLGSLSTNGGMAVVFTGAGLPAGLTAGITYWIVRQSNTSFKVYSDPGLNNLVDITATGTGTFASINIGPIRYFEKVTGIALDTNGRAWYQRSSGYYIFLGNSITGTVGLTNTVGNGLIYYKGYLFLFYNSRICYTAYTPGTDAPNPTWINEWYPLTGAPAPGTQIFNTPVGTPNIHEAIVGQDDVIYITDASFVASLREKEGSTFDPTNTATYIWTNSALALPTTETAQCLTELGTNLLVGGIYNYIYPWDRISTSFKYPILIADNGVTHMITVNTNAYIFAGKRGRIYVTNGSQAEFYVKVPDYISGIEPIFTWQGVAYNKNQLYFGVSAQNNAQTQISSYNGLWAVDITKDSLRVPTLQSTTNATVTAVYAYNSVTSGFGLSVAWKTLSNTYGIDNSTQTPYTSYTSYIDTDIIPIGQFLTKRTLTNIEFKLSTPLVNGEGIKISYRNSMSGAYTLIGETTAVGSISDLYLVNFDLSQWLQFRIEMKSTATNPSYVRLYELRIR